MEFVTKIEQLGFFSSLDSLFDSVDAALDNIYILSFLVTFLLIANAYQNAKKAVYYNRDKVKDSKADKMKGHTLNTEYGFDKKKKINLTDINRTYMYFHIIAAIAFFLACIIASFFLEKIDHQIIAGFVTFLIVTIVGNKIVTNYIGKKYENVK